MINERFKELYSEAAAYAFDQRFIASPDGPRELQDVINEKFAELIVKECASLYFRGIDEISAETEHKIYDLIIKHFGVEE